MLTPVGGINMEFVIVNTDFVISVSRVDGNLDVGSEEVWGGGDVEGIKGGVLEDEVGFFGLEDGPYDEKYHDHDEGEDEEAGA